MSDIIGGHGGGGHGGGGHGGGGHFRGGRGGWGGGWGWGWPYDYDYDDGVYVVDQPAPSAEDIADALAQRLKKQSAPVSVQGVESGTSWWKWALLSALGIGVGVYVYKKVR